MTDGPLLPVRAPALDSDAERQDHLRPMWPPKGAADAETGRASVTHEDGDYVWDERATRDRRTSYQRQIYGVVD